MTPSELVVLAASLVAAIACPWLGVLAYRDLRS